VNTKKKSDEPRLKPLNPQIDNTPHVADADAKEFAVCHGPMPDIALKKSIFKVKADEYGDAEGEDVKADTNNVNAEPVFFSNTIVSSDHSTSGTLPLNSQCKTGELDQNKRPVILLAEEDRVQSNALREALETEGFAVDTVFSGDMALNKLLDQQYAAAIIDWRMTGLPGQTVLKVCMVKQKPVVFPIIIVSAFASPQELKECEEIGAAATFSKPLDIPILLTRLNQLVGTPHAAKNSAAQ
jgi:CheY-like chemotaxis protein